MYNVRPEQFGGCFEHIRSVLKKRVEIKSQELALLEEELGLVLAKLTAYQPPLIVIYHEDDLTKTCKVDLDWGYISIGEKCNQIKARITLIADYEFVQYLVVQSARAPKCMIQEFRTAEEPLPAPFLEVMDQYFKIKE